MKYLVVLFCLFNFVMWIIFIRRFKKLFSTDNIIEETKEEYNKLVRDFNKNTDMGITVLDEKIRQLKALVAEAEKTIRVLNDIESKNLSVQALHSSINSSQIQGRVKNVQKRAGDAYSKNKGDKTSLKPDMSVSLTTEGSHEAETNLQGTLFEENYSALDTNTTVNVNSHGESWAKVPVVTPEVFVNEKPILPKKDTKSRIVEMYDSGYTAEEIALELQMTDTEVQFALSLENRL